MSVLYGLRFKTIPLQRPHIVQMTYKAPILRALIYTKVEKSGGGGKLRGSLIIVFLAIIKTPTTWRKTENLNRSDKRGSLR